MASSIDAPQPGHTLFDFCQDVGEKRYESDWDTIPVETFARYGLWFQRRLVPTPGAGAGGVRGPPRLRRRLRAEAGLRGAVRREGGGGGQRAERAGAAAARAGRGRAGRAPR
ncbi:hypothetical protein GCM10020000_44410 [Streptomyces olivoverticillatus]